MIRNYLLIAFRNIVKHKLFTVINILGLALSMSLCMMVILHVADYLSYDHFHPHPNRTYRVLTQLRNPQGKGFLLASSPLPLRETVLKEDAVVEDAVTFYPALKGDVLTGDRSVPLSGAFTTPSFFTVFGFKLAQGNAATALSQPNGIVLTHITAQKLFGRATAIGRSVAIGSLGTFQVTGVLEEQKENTHIPFQAYAPISALAALENNKILGNKSNQWNSFNDAYTYIVLKGGIRRSTAQASLDRIAASLYDDPSQGTIAFPLQALGSISPSWEETYNNIGNGTTWGKVLAEIGLGLVILISACFNYTNLSIARSLSRAKEVGIRKMAGASRLQIFGQYVMEAILITFCALIIAYVLLAAIRHEDLFNANTGKPDEMMQWQMLLAFVLFSIFSGLLAGSLPAWILSAFNPSEVLKRMASHKVFGKMALRKSLLVFQLSLSLVITIFLYAFYRQFTHMADADLGYIPEGILTVDMQGHQSELLRQEVLSLSGVEDVASLSSPLGRYNDGRISLRTDAAKPAASMDYFRADASLARVMSLRFAAGGNFRPGQQDQVLINEKALTGLGLKDAASAVGQALLVNDSIQTSIAGVLKDFHYQHLGKPIEPLVIWGNAGDYRLLEVKVRTADKAQLGQQVKAVWAKLYPDQDFRGEWLAEKLYKEQRQLSSVSFIGYLSFMTVLIAMMGLLAMVIYSTALRHKEIGVRKVMGADVKGLILLLSGGFIRLIIIASLIALPLGWIAAQLFLQNFPVRISFGVGSLLLCFGLMLAIGLLAIISQTWRAALMNPAATLKND